MTPQDKVEFTKLILITADKYKRSFTESFLEMYWHSLKEFSLKDIYSAFEKHFNNPDNGHFLPHQSDILRILQGDSESQALQAWSKVSNAISTVGAYRSIVFDDMLIHAVISDMGSWISLCRQTEQDLKFSEHKFLKRYRSYLLKRPKQYPNRLIGIIEHTNQICGSSSASPCLYGDEESAFMTHSEGEEPHLLSSQKMTLLSDLVSSKEFLQPSLKLKLDSSLNNQKAESQSALIDNNTRGIFNEQ